MFDGYAHYTASKGSVVAMTTELAKEFKRYGIVVNTVAPGAMFTLGKEMTVAKLDEIPTADSVAIVAYGMCMRMVDGATGEYIVADSGMMRNIMALQSPIN